MIRMIESRSAAHAKAYFADALARADYYMSDQELPGIWQGKLAARLGLSGPASKEAFSALCENRHPGTGEKLTPRVKKDRRTGYDINFHCPKSVSILHVLSSDDHILNAFRDSVTETMKAIEADSRTRVRAKGRDEDRRTGELVWAEFVHQTARPVEGYLPDPHLHAHCFTFNATWDPVEARIKAGQFGDIKRDMPYYQACFQKVLADKLMDLGYRVRQTDKSFEIEGVPPRVLDLFSKRTDEIGRIAKEKGITDAKELSELGARTRAPKQKGATMTELKEGWRNQIAALGPEPEVDTIVRVVPVKDAPGVTVWHDPPLVQALPGKVEPPAPPAVQFPGPEREAGTPTPERFTPAKEAPLLTARACIDYAVQHCFERASVMDARRILEVAIHQAVGVAQIRTEEIAQDFAADQRIIHVTERDRTLCTTKEVLSEERRMVELARASRGTIAPLYETAPEIELTGQQHRAVAHILTTRDGVSIIRGVAGAGKTTMMKEAVNKITEIGKTVTAVAPTARASRGALREAGFEEATTVAHLLVDTHMQEKIKGQVVWVDEAGLLGTGDMTRLLELTAQQQARLILSGDTRQHASVVRGDALRILNTVADIPVAEVSKIHRQQTAAYRDAIKDLAGGDIGRAFEKLDRLGFIKDIGENSLVKDYVAAVKEGKSTLVISPTHAQGEEITGEIRAELRREGLLGNKEIEVDRLKNLNLTEAEKSDPRRFATGQIVQFTQNAPTFQRGSQWTVSRATTTEVEVTNGTGESRPLPLGRSGRYEVFERETILLSKGDRIRITKNGFDDDARRLNNGDILTVMSVSKGGSIVLQNEISHATYRIGKTFGHLSHGHCVTSYAAQGKNVREVFIYQPASSFGATDARQFYVSVSRARDRAHIYTDDRDELLRHASNLRERQSALELIGIERQMDAALRPRHTKQDIEQRRDQRTHQRDHYEPGL